LPELNLAGRFDRLVEVDGKTYVLDIKTGQSLDYSWQSIAIQLAVYAQAATIYDPESETHEAMPDVDQARGIVVHLPAGEARAAAYWVDLEAGRRGIDLTKVIMAWRTTKNIASEVVPEPSELRTWVAGRVTAIVEAGHGQDLAAAWPDGLATLRASAAHTDGQLEQIAQLCAVIEAKHRMAFPDDGPRRTAQPAPTYI
jgi:PD-(D/E)XK nuclease superfamily